jgi:hypothetical protein
LFPTGEPPPDPAEEESAPPDLLGDADRWPIIAGSIARRLFDPRPVLALAAAWADAHADAAERALVDRLHAEVEASTDYQLIAEINAEYLAEDNTQHPDYDLAA